MQLKKYPKAFLKAVDSNGKNVNLNKYLKVILDKIRNQKLSEYFQNSQVVSISHEPDANDADLVTYLAGDGSLEKYIGYLKPGSEDLASVVLVATEVESRINIIG